MAKLLEGRLTSDGAGVKLTRMFSNDQAIATDPFLMLDLFGSNQVEDYIAGFPMHPHRGIETVTYMLDGYVDHEDSLGNKGTIGPGDVQWMTAGNGIQHQEMPRRSEGWMRGFQLWVNLPKASKMMPPRYRGILSKDIPVADLGGGSFFKVIAGESQGVKGPVKDLVVDVNFLDVYLNYRTTLEYEIPDDRNALVVVYEGALGFGDKDMRAINSGSVGLLGPGDMMKFKVGNKPVKFLFVSGRPLREPIAWGGPIVMNTDEELKQAFAELRGGTFIKKAR